MPPRISLPVRLRASNAQQCSSTITSALRAFSTTPTNNATTSQQKHRRRDPYAQAQAVARKAANISRRAVLKEERAASLGDPVRGITTPFVQSFDSRLPQAPITTGADISSTTTSADPTKTPEGPDATSERYLNHFLSPKEVKESLAISDKLSTPTSRGDVIAEAEWQTRAVSGLSADAVEQQKENAAAAIKRIVSLANGSSKDHTRVNIQRCIDTFGRHNTDKVLPPRPTAKTTQQASVLVPVNGSVVGADGTAPLNPDALRRAGPDTGSSEVQIAILTAKIRTLANFVETRGKQDKTNKRNLRLLVHRRQKLLTYLRKKERGSARWQHLVETLGLTDGTWKGEISL